VANAPSGLSARASASGAVRAHRLAAAVGSVVVESALCWRIGLRPDLPAFLYLGAIGVLLTITDLTVRRLPDALTLSGFAVGATLLGLATPFINTGASRLLHAFVGAGLLWVLLVAQRLAAPNGTGRGDVKLGGMCGLYLGWLGQLAWITGLATTVVLAGSVAAVILATRHASRETGLTYGPFLLAGTLIAILTHT
jgi:leader peptidase (prepilin peptidase)/N-methyltransferase